MSYPSLEQYTEALQYPKNCLKDFELKGGIVAKSGLGLPLALCGGFALTYAITTKAGKRYAVRCFHKESNNLEKRYRAISSRLKALNSPYFVDFDFQSQGVQIAGEKYPLVKMAWASGFTLGEYVANNYRNKGKLQQLNSSLHLLASFLEKVRIAHGDIQPGNVMVANEGRTVQLIDYDGMYVDEIQNLGSAELGLRNFQHPNRSAGSWDLSLDRFSFIEIDLALRVLQYDPSIWLRTNSDEMGFVFKANDFAEPGQSQVFQELIASAEFSTDARNFAAICKSPYDSVPTLEEFLANRNIPQVAIPIGLRRIPAAYLGSYPVVDATDYGGCYKHVGDLVEVIGQIVDVSKRKTRYGKPYVFLNFGDWRGNIFKINIWSEGLAALSREPDESWIGRWVSVVGLMEPPFSSSRWKYTHLSITITRGSEISVLTKKEAKFRLTAPSPQPEKGVAAHGTENKKILEKIKETPKLTPSEAWLGRSSSTPPRSASPAIAPATSPNQAILQKMKSSASPSVSSAKGTSTVRTSPIPIKPQTGKSFPLAAAVIVGIALLFITGLLGQNLPRSIVSPPTIRPTTAPTFIAQAPSIKITPANTESPACNDWMSVKSGFQGQTICVYGRVEFRKTFFSNGKFSYYLLRFSSDPHDFYITSHKGRLNALIGQCISAESVLSVDANGVLFMEVAEISDYRCP